MAKAPKKLLLGLKGPFGLYLGLSCFAVLAVQGMVYVQIVDQTIGAFPIMKRLRMIGGNSVQDPKVAVLRSDLNASFSGPKPEYYYDLSAFWDYQAQLAGMEHRLITDAELERGLGNSATVLILPWTNCLTEGQKKSVKDFLNSGGSLIATGAPGARDQKNEWSGWEFLAELTGLMQLVSLTPENLTYASFRGNQFYSGTVPAGLQLDLPKQVLIAGVGRTPDIYWSDGKWHPESVDWPSEAALGIHGVYGKGRVVWLGFNERLSGNNRIRQYMDNYIQAAIKWVGRQPLSVPALWPDQKEMAAVPVGDFGTELRAAQEAADVFRQEKIPATMFCQSGVVANAPATVSILREAVELGTTGDTLDSFGNQGLIKQVDRLKKAKKDMERQEQLIFGFKPPQNSWNTETMMALRTAGYQYYLDPAGSQKAVPDLMEFRAGSLLGRHPELARIPAPWSDDTEVVAQYEGPTPWNEDIGDAVLKEFELSRYIGGVYTFTFQAGLLGAPENRPILRSILQRMKNPKVWFASAMGLTEWWSKREKIRVEARLVHEKRIRVAITNRGRFDMTNYAVDLYLPYRPRKVRILSEFLGKTPPRFQVLPNEETLRLDFEKLKRQSSQVFLVALDEI